MSRPLLLGAVAYDPKVLAIWSGFRAWFRDRGFDLDFVLYSNYERQVEDLIAGRVDVAWNSPLAWIRAQRLGAARGFVPSAIAMRDSDRDLRSVIAVRAESPVTTLADLRGQIVGTGAVDSPQGTLLPLSRLRQPDGVANAEFTVRHFDVGVGLHGDHIGGERHAATALRDGAVDAACMVDSNLLLFAQEGTLVAGSIRVVATTDPYDHCNMTSGPAADLAQIDRFVELLLAMSYSDVEVRRLLDLEGLKQWLPGRTEGYALLERAVVETGFYTSEGGVDAPDYRP